MSQSKTVGVAWYYPDQWDKIRSHSKDRTGMAKNFSDWERNAVEAVQKFEKDGYTVHKVFIDVQMLVAWCKRHSVQVDGKSRADYVTHLLAERSGLTRDI